MKKILLLALLCVPAMAMKKPSAKADNQTIQEVLKIVIAERDRLVLQEDDWVYGLEQAEKGKDEKQVAKAKQLLADHQKELALRKTQIDKLIAKAAK